MFNSPHTQPLSLTVLIFSIMMILSILMVVTTVFSATAYNEMRTRKTALARSRRY
jgi:hypothetical protein